MNKRIHLFTMTTLFFGALMISATSSADDHENHERHQDRTYEIRFTNLTAAQPIAPVLVTTHRKGFSFFTEGKAPMDKLANLAEAGDGHPMAEKLHNMAGFTSAVVGNKGNPPGGSTRIIIQAKKRDHLSLGAMLANTNDAFAGLRDVKLPKGWKTVTYMAPAYDAGTETNDESCATVPGPACGGEALSPNDPGEGFVSISNGIHSIGGLEASKYDWRNPVAKVVIRRIR
jgi:hypothetical protein